MRTMFMKWRQICLAAALLLPVSAFAASVAPIADGNGNKTCADITGDTGITIDATVDVSLNGNQSNGTKTTASGKGDGYVFTTVFNSTTGVLNWSVSAGAGVVPGIDAVIVKGTNTNNIYIYDPVTTPIDLETDSTGDTGLCPIGIPTGSPTASCSTQKITGIDFCYDYHLTVAKTAIPSYDRYFYWSITKTAVPTSLTIPPDSGAVNYTVGVTESAPVDKNFAVSGAVTITNATPFAATITGINDLLAGNPVSVTCPGGNAQTLASTASLTCPYSVAVADTTTRTNVATVTTSGTVAGATGTATATFGGPTNTFYDSIMVNDTNGQSWSFSATGSQSYAMTLGCETPSPYTNTASIVPAAASGANAASATASVAITCVNPVAGCTLSQGYWKTHSSHGPAPSDPTWNDNPPGGPDAAFFLSGTSWLGALQTNPSGGNAYWTLAHQYIAAVLNTDMGASAPSAVASAVADAQTLFSTYTPAAIGALSSSDPLRLQFLNDATVLDAYNNGLSVGGPPACVSN